MKNAWMAAAVALSLVPIGAAAQHGGHGGHASGDRDREAPPTRRDPPPAPKPAGPTEIYVLVDGRGFSPDEIPLEVGEAAEIIVMRTTDATCVREIVVPDLAVRVALAVDVPVRFTLKPTKPGRIHFACGDGHVGGDIVVR